MNAKQIQKDLENLPDSFFSEMIFIDDWHNLKIMLCLTKKLAKNFGIRNFEMERFKRLLSKRIQQIEMNPKPMSYSFLNFSVENYKIIPKNECGRR